MFSRLLCLSILESLPRTILATTLLLLALPSTAEPLHADAIKDTSLRAATITVENSDKYLHQSRLKRGMTGYGLTVMAGAEIVRFEAEVVSVLKNFTPSHDIILVRLSGLNLENSGIVQGMSGSPVYIRDPHDGQHKLIGAVAYGWSFQKEPLAGIQPISQMLAASDASSESSTASDVLAGSSHVSTPDARLTPQYKAAAFTPEKTDFSRFARALSPEPVSAAAIKPLATPLMVAGLRPRTQRRLEQALADSNLSLVQSGSAGAVSDIDQSLNGLTLQPGAALAVPLIIGDAEITAIGTVTEVIGDRIIGFGHPLFSNGRIRLPMSTAYVHTVVSSLNTSFKLASNLQPVGVLDTDEYSAVAGRVGPQVDMIPMTVNVKWLSNGQSQTYNFLLARERFMTPIMAWMMAMEGVVGTRNLPDEHTLDYAVTIDFGPLGQYQIDNRSANRDVADLVSDLLRPMMIMSNNPFGEGHVQSITVTAQVREDVHRADIVSASPDKNAYAPGDTVTLRTRLWQWRGDRFIRDLRLILPHDLPEGDYRLTVGGSSAYAQAMLAMNPQQFDPKNLQQLLQAVQLIAEPRQNQLCAVLALNAADVSLERHRFAAPATIAQTLSAAWPADFAPAENLLIVADPVDFVVTGQHQVNITVKKPSRIH